MGMRGRPISTSEWMAVGMAPHLTRFQVSKKRGDHSCLYTRAVSAICRWAQTLGTTCCVAPPVYAPCGAAGPLITRALGGMLDTARYLIELHAGRTASPLRASARDWKRSDVQYAPVTPSTLLAYRRTGPEPGGPPLELS